MSNTYTRIARLKDASSFKEYIQSLGIDLPFDEVLLSGDLSPLARPYKLKSGRTIGNRFCTHPMEGWDGTQDGLPTDFTIKRWKNFGRSGAKLIWGGEAVAVRHDGRANPNQLMIRNHTLNGLETLRQELVNVHRQNFGSLDDLVVGLQLTHSGRFSRPNIKTKIEPRILYHHPLLDKMFSVDPNLPVLTDMEIEDLIAEYVRAARDASKLGFDFVDIKHCHGYLGHEFLSSYSRPGKYGGSFENRTRFIREIVAGIRSAAPGLEIGVRVSAFDFLPFRAGEDGVGHPLEYRDDNGQYPYAFGGDPDNPLKIKSDDLFSFISLLRSLDIELVNLSCGSPYYNPHIMRPAFFPPSDGYQPPEDPLVGVARQVNFAARVKAQFPDMALVGTGYSYLQEWLPNVGQFMVANKRIDFVGLGRMVLSYPEMPADVLAGNPLARKKICRTFSDCTTAPRKGLISGCYPLDEFYKGLPEADQLKFIKAQL